MDFLASAGQSCWQFLPTGPTDPLFDNSPYMTRSAFAGSPLLLSPILLQEHGLINKNDLQVFHNSSKYHTSYPPVIHAKQQLLQQAHSRFNMNQKAFTDFRDSTPWLDDYTLFMACHDRFAGQSWNTWPADISAHTPAALKQLRFEEQERISYYEFEQFEFYRQWRILQKHADHAGIRLIGDIPFYISTDSADVWAHQDIFDLDPLSRRPEHVAGVPPDYFSKTGQKWGNPLYRWHSKDKKTNDKLNKWWAARFQAVFNLVDIARIDHFRGFESYWATPAHEETAMNGQWLPGPGISFFTDLQEKLGPLPIIAEDLGEITEAVNDLRENLGFPGMKVLQFAFDNNPNNDFLPHNYSTSNCVVYTGTHDNNTTVGWFLSSELTNQDRLKIKAHANQEIHSSNQIHNDLIYLAMSSIARLSIFPLQDILGFGSDCRMNTPGTSQGNWSWRCAPEFLSPEVASSLKKSTALFNRLPNL